MTDKLEALKALTDEIAPGYMQEWGFERNSETGFADVGVFNESGEWTPFIQVSVSDYSDNSMHDAKLAEFLTLANPVAIRSLLAALEEKDQQLDAEVREWTQKYVNENARAKSAEQREEHLKASVDVLSAKNAELEQQSEATQQGVQILTEAIGAHGYIVGCLERNRPDLALEESLKWMSVFAQAAEQVEGE